MQKRFVTNLGILLFLNLLIKPFWIFGIEREVQCIVGDASYGEYFALFNFTFLLNIVLDFGITNFNNRNIAQNTHLLTKHFSSIFTLKLALAFLYTIAVFIIGLIVGYESRLVEMLLILAFNQFLISMVFYLRSNLLGLHLFKTDSIISVLDRLIMIAICAVILWGNLFDIKMDVILFMYIQTASYFLTALVSFILVVQKAEFLKLKWNLTFSLMILKKSLPFAILVLLMTFYNRIDSVMLERILPHGADQAGVYAKAYRLLDATNMVAYLFSVILLPTFSRMIKYKESVEQLTKLSFILLSVISVLVAVGCSFYSTDIMDLLYSDRSKETAVVFAALMCCFVATSTTYIFGTLLTANGSLKQLNLIAGSGMLINIVLNLILIPHLEAVGSAISSLITQVLTALAQVLMVQHVFKFKVNYKLLITLSVFVIGVVVFNVISKSLSGSWIINFFLMLSASILWAFIIRLISLQSILRVIKYG